MHDFCVTFWCLKMKLWFCVVEQRDPGEQSLWWLSHMYGNDLLEAWILSLQRENCLPLLALEFSRVLHLVSEKKPLGFCVSDLNMRYNLWDFKQASKAIQLGFTVVVVVVLLSMNIAAQVISTPLLIKYFWDPLLSFGHSFSMLSWHHLWGVS